MTIWRERYARILGYRSRDAAHPGAGSDRPPAAPAPTACTDNFQPKSTPLPGQFSAGANKNRICLENWFSTASLDAMRPIRNGSLFLTLALFVGNALAECQRNEHDVFEDIGCASEAFAAAGRELNAVYTKLMQSLDVDEKKALVQSQRSWLAFIDANARFIYAIQGDGSLGRLVVINAREEHTRVRVRELKAWAPK
jgi:uncharacterized protein YecT (DUF1311 family)